MTLSQSLSLYNQDRLSDDDFVAQFVARKEVLDALVRRLEAAREDGTGGQQILVGARGMGKTSLLRRLAIEVRSRPEFSARFVPLRFREEQYNVLRLGDFWRNCGEALAEWAEADGREDLARRLDGALAGEAWAGDDLSADAFSLELSTLNRRAVLLVDNLDLILNALSKEDKWVLRRHLQARNGPLVIGAATQALADSADRDAAFYEFFQPHHLEPLSQSETEACMRALAERRGAHGKPVLEVLARQPERLRTLHVLTGGNPRVLALIYRLLESAETDKAMADLEVLLDQVTPYYKARIEEYQSPQQRAVIDAIALHWDPIASGDLSRMTGVVPTTLSPLLIKLKKDGLIEAVETSGAYAGHQLVERFLNIWYLMRHGTRRAKQKMRWLVAFLSNFYSRSNLTGIADRMRSKGAAARWHPDYAFALDEALLLASAINPKALGECVDKAVDGESADVEPLNNGGARKPDFVAEVRIATDMIARGVALGRAGDLAAAIAAYDDVVARFAGAQAPALRERVAIALVNKGVTLTQAGHRAAGTAVFDDIVARFADAGEPALREQVARALVNKGFALSEAGDAPAAIAFCEEVLARFANQNYSRLKDILAEAQLLLGRLLLDFHGDIVRAEALFQRAAETAPALALSNLAWLYLQDNRVGNALVLRKNLSELPEPGLSLIDAGLQLAQHNFGLATERLAVALDRGFDGGGMSFDDDFERFLRLAVRMGFGEQLIGWFETTGFADKLAPIHVALKAYVRGERALLDANPETQGPARILFDRLAAPRPVKEDSAATSRQEKRRRGRPRKRS